MNKTNKRAAPSPKNAASKTNDHETTTILTGGTSVTRRFGPNAGHLIMLLLAGSGVASE